MRWDVAGVTSLASFRRFWAVAASRNSVLPPGAIVDVPRLVELEVRSGECPVIASGFVED